MFGAMEVAPTLIWVLILFSFVVYISIIGYLQYIVLTIYIHNLAHCSGDYCILPKAAVGCIPAQQNFNKKIKRGTVSFEEMIAIAETLDVGYEQAFIFPDGGKIKTSNK